MPLPAPEARRLLESADHGILATIGPEGMPHQVPVCFALDGSLVAVPIDRVKQKGAATLRRVTNLEGDQRATLLCERWDADDWSRLWWVRAGLRAVAAEPDDLVRLEAALRARYRQYREAVDPFETLLVFRVESLTGWSA